MQFEVRSLSQRRQSRTRGATAYDLRADDEEPLIAKCTCFRLLEAPRRRRFGYDGRQTGHAAALADCARRIRNGGRSRSFAK
jgi:hypothetical protein